MPDVSYFTATVRDNDDPDQLGRLLLVIPAMTGADDPHPDWIAPRVGPGAGPAAGWWWIPPVDAIVVVEADAAGQLRWTGGTWGAVNVPPDFLLGNYPRRGGFTSPAGAHTLALDDDTGLVVLVANPDDPDGPANYLALDGSANDGKGQAKIGLASGALFMLDGTKVVAMTPAGATLVLDEDNGITLIHQGGAESLSLTDGVSTLAGTSVVISGGGVTIVGAQGVTLTNDSTGATPTEPLILGTSFLTDLVTFLTSCAADTAMSPGVAAAASSWLPQVAAALGAGAPYLSTVSSTV